MKDIEILDCTLRDGGRIIDCKFQDNEIIGIGKKAVKDFSSLKKAIVP